MNQYIKLGIQHPFQNRLRNCVNCAFTGHTEQPYQVMDLVTPGRCTLFELQRHSVYRCQTTRDVRYVVPTETSSTRRFSVRSYG